LLAALVIEGVRRGLVWASAGLRGRVECVGRTLAPMTAAVWGRRAATEPPGATIARIGHAH